MPHKPPHTNGVPRELARIVIERRAHAVSRGVQLVNDWDIEALPKDLPDVRPHAVAPCHLQLVFSLEGMHWRVDEVSTQLAHILQDIGSTR